MSGYSVAAVEQNGTLGSGKRIFAYKALKVVKDTFVMYCRERLPEFRSRTIFVPIPW